MTNIGLSQFPVVKESQTETITNWKNINGNTLAVRISQCRLQMSRIEVKGVICEKVVGKENHMDEIRFFEKSVKEYLREHNLKLIQVVNHWPQYRAIVCGKDNNPICVN